MENALPSGFEAGFDGMEMRWSEGKYPRRPLPQRPYSSSFSALHLPVADAPDQAGAGVVQLPAAIVILLATIVAHLAFQPSSRESS